MNHSRPARAAAHRDERRADMDYKAMTKNLLDRIDDKHIQRTIYEVVNNFVKNLDKFVR